MLLYKEHTSSEAVFTVLEDGCCYTRSIRLQRLYLQFWRVDAVIQGAYVFRGCIYSSGGWILLYKEHTSSEAVFTVLEGGCCYTRSIRLQRLYLQFWRVDAVIQGAYIVAA